MKRILFVYLTLIAVSASGLWADFFAATGVSYRPVPDNLKDIAQIKDWQRSKEQKKEWKEWEKNFAKDNLETMVKEATEEMMAKFKKAGRAPKAVLFVERLPSMKTGYAGQLIEGIKAVAGDTKVLGTGGAGT